jgi:isoquinoline 1-oxidoreductase beta subunit
MDRGAAVGSHGAGAGVVDERGMRAVRSLAIGSRSAGEAVVLVVGARQGDVLAGKKGREKATVDVAIDTGPFLVNPLAAERQLEEQVAMGVAATLHQQLTIEKGRAVEGNFEDYPLLRAAEMPEVGVHWVRATDDPIAGIGEEALGWVAPAICNAVFAATGKRIRSLPLKNHDLSWT